MCGVCVMCLCVMYICICGTSVYCVSVCLSICVVCLCACVCLCGVCVCACVSMSVYKCFCMCVSVCGVYIFWVSRAHPALRTGKWEGTVNCHLAGHVVLDTHKLAAVPVPLPASSGSACGNLGTDRANSGFSTPGQPQAGLCLTPASVSLLATKACSQGTCQFL